jgi:putative heme iron utilization protein
MADYRSAVRALLEGQRFGVLSTLSARYAGWPFGSVTPYALSDAGRPILLLSSLAEHTRNIAADARASLFVQEEGADPQAVARMTVLGTVEPATEATAKERYVAWHPRAAAYFEMADFGLFVLKPTQARFVGGFGEMGWVDLTVD